MAHSSEPMDVDISVFDDKENAFQHSNMPPLGERGREELDASEMNMKLRYSLSPAASPMSKSYRADVTSDTLNHTHVAENNNMTRSLNITSSKNDTFVKVPTTLPLQTIHIDHHEGIRKSILHPMDAAQEHQNDSDDTLSLPSSSSSVSEATTPVKEPMKPTGSPIMRGLKSVLSMFRPSQSPTASTEHGEFTHDEIPTINDENLSTLPSEPVMASTPVTVSKIHRDEARKSSPIKENLVFKDDLERELQWKEDTTIIFSKEKIPIQKLLYHELKATDIQRDRDILPSVENLDCSVEPMDVSYNTSIQGNKTIIMDNHTAVSKNTTIDHGDEDESLFLDCETTFTEKEPDLENKEPTFASLNINQIDEDSSLQKANNSTDVSISINEHINISSLRGNIENPIAEENRVTDLVKQEEPASEKLELDKELKSNQSVEIGCLEKAILPKGMPETADDEVCYGDNNLVAESNDCVTVPENITNYVQSMTCLPYLHNTIVEENNDSKKSNVDSKKQFDNDEQSENNLNDIVVRSNEVNEETVIPANKIVETFNIAPLEESNISSRVNVTVDSEISSEIGKELNQVDNKLVECTERLQDDLSPHNSLQENYSFTDIKDDKLDTTELKENSTFHILQSKDHLNVLSANAQNVINQEINEEANNPANEIVESSSVSLSLKEKHIVYPVNNVTVDSEMVNEVIKEKLSSVECAEVPQDDSTPHYSLRENSSCSNVKEDKHDTTEMREHSTISDLCHITDNISSIVKETEGMTVAIYDNNISEPDIPIAHPNVIEKITDEITDVIINVQHDELNYSVTENIPTQSKEEFEPDVAIAHPNVAEETTGEIADLIINVQHDESNYSLTNNIPTQSKEESEPDEAIAHPNVVEETTGEIKDLIINVQHDKSNYSLTDNIPTQTKEDALMTPPKVEEYQKLSLNITQSDAASLPNTEVISVTNVDENTCVPDLIKDTDSFANHNMSSSTSNNNGDVEIDNKIENDERTDVLSSTIQSLVGPDNMCDFENLPVGEGEPIKNDDVDSNTVDDEVIASENNSPFVSLNAKITDASNLIPENEPVKLDERVSAQSKVHTSPPISPKPGGYNFNFDEIDDPFATKTKVRVTPVRSLDETFDTKITSDNTFISESAVNADTTIIISDSGIQDTQKYLQEENKLGSLNDTFDINRPVKDIETEKIKYEEDPDKQDSELNKTVTFEVISQTKMATQEIDNNINVSYTVNNVPESMEENINPFENKTKLRLSQSPEIDVIDPFASKCQVSQSPDQFIEMSKDTEHAEITKIEENKEHQNNEESDNSNGNDRTLCEVPTEDEDTLEGPFIETGLDYEKDDIFDVQNIEINQFTDIAQENEENCEGGEMFIDAEAFDFLMNQNQTSDGDGGKESLFLKFDPLFTQRVNSDGVVDILSKLQKKQSTPKKLRKFEMPKMPTPTAAGPSFRLHDEPNNEPEEEAAAEVNTTVNQKPTMIVPPAPNPEQSPRKNTATPSRSTRISSVFTSPAMAVIDRLLSISANNSPAHNVEVPQTNAAQNEANIALMQLREALTEKENHVQHLRSENNELRDRLDDLESQLTSLETETEKRRQNVSELSEKLAEKERVNKIMSELVEGYERTIAGLMTGLEEDKQQHAVEREQLARERDEQTSHLASMEVAFNDLHSKYEKSKHIIFTYKAQEDIRKKSVEEAEENMLKMQDTYEQLKQHATSKLNIANRELEKINKAHESEVLKMTTIMKRKDMMISSLEETLAQKTKANEELTAICDELINKVG